MNGRKHSKGFTIPEILVAGALFTLVVVAVTTGIRVALDIEHKSDLRRQAAIKLRSAIDMTTDFDESNNYGTCRLSFGDGNTVDCDIEVISVRTDNGFPSRTFSWMPGTPLPHMYKIQISWSGDSIAFDVYD